MSWWNLHMLVEFNFLQDFRFLVGPVLHDHAVLDEGNCTAYRINTSEMYIRSSVCLWRINGPYCRLCAAATCSCHDAIIPPHLSPSAPLYLLLVSFPAILKIFPFSNANWLPFHARSGVSISSSYADFIYPRLWIKIWSTKWSWTVDCFAVLPSMAKVKLYIANRARLFARTMLSKRSGFS